MGRDTESQYMIPTEKQLGQIAFESWKTNNPFAEKQDRLYEGAKHYWDNEASYKLKWRAKRKALAAVLEWEKIKCRVSK